MREISDWGLAEELALERPILLVAFVSRLDPRHVPFLIELEELAAQYAESAEARLVDLVENPSLVSKLKLVRLPAVVLYSSGVEYARWQGETEFEEVAATMEALSRSPGLE